MVEGNVSRVEATASRADFYLKGSFFYAQFFFFQFLLCFLGKWQARDTQKFSFY